MLAGDLDLGDASPYALLESERDEGAALIGHVAYVCGSPEFVTDTMKALMKGRLFPRDIYREDFYDAADRAAGTSVIRSPLIRR